MMMRNAFILTNYIANTVPNFYSFDYKCIADFLTFCKCMIFRHRCQGIGQSCRFFLHIYVLLCQDHTSSPHHVYVFIRLRLHRPMKQASWACESSQRGLRLRLRGQL